MHQVLYRKYRPQVFEDVCGQSHITDVLRFEAERDRIAHAYLFCGSRGTGKTTCAKILAKAVNCEDLRNGSPCCKCRSCLDIDGGMTTDVIEMDAASNNSVDDIRRLCEEVVYTPSMLKKKVYIIDEVHMLSQGAFNALLKTIEEPPSHVVFVLATTELHKIPSTIVSRCQRFDFRRIDMNVISDRLEYIASKEEIPLTREAAQLIARQAQGGMRDAIGLFELCGAGGADVNGERVKNVLGLSGYDAVASVMENVKNGNMGELFGIIAKVTASSKDVAVFWQELISFVRDMLVCKYSGDAAGYLDLTAVEAELLSSVAARFNLAELIYYCKVLDEGAATMARNPQNKRLTAEMCLLRMCRPELENTGDALSARIARLEDKISLISMGAPVSAEQVIKPEPVVEKEPEKVAEKEAPKYEAEVVNSEGLQRIRDISEAVNRLSAIKQGLVPILLGSEVYSSADGKTLTVCTDDFGCIIFGKPDGMDALSEAFALAKITDGKANIRVLKKGEAKITGSVADELGNML